MDRLPVIVRSFAAIEDAVSLLQMHDDGDLQDIGAAFYNSDAYKELHALYHA